MIFSKELEKLAEELYPDELVKTQITYDDDFHRPRTKEKLAYLAGAAALENLIMKSGDFPLAKRCNESIEQMKLSVAIDSAYLRGARTQHGEDQLIIGALREQIDDMNKNCISLGLHESRMKEADKMYYALDNMYLDLNEKYEALKKVVDEIRHVRGEK